MKEMRPLVRISIYRSTLIALMSQGISRPILLPLKHTHTIKVTFPPLTDLSQCLGKYAWPGFRIHRQRLDFHPKTREDSSDQMTRFQSSTVQCLYFHAHSSLLCLCFAVRKGFLRRIRENKLISFSQRRRVKVET